MAKGAFKDGIVSPLNGKSGGSVSQRSTANTGFGKAGMRIAPYKPQGGSYRSDTVAAPNAKAYNSMDIRGVTGFDGPKAQPMYPGLPSALGKTTRQYGTGLIKEESGDKGKGLINQYSVGIPGNKQPAQAANNLGKPGGGG